MSKFPSENHAAVSAAATVLASVTEVEDGNAPPWRPDDDAISSRGALSGPGNDGQRFSHLRSIILTDIGRQEFGRGMTACGPRIVDEPDAFPPEFWQPFLQSSLTTLGGKVPACLRGHDLEEAHHRKSYATVAAEVGGGQPRGEAVWGRVTRRGGACRTLHDTGHWLVLTYCSNSFITVRRTAELAEVANCVPALALLVAKCYGTRPADVFFPDGLRGDQDNCLLQRCPAGGPHGAGNVLSGVATRAESFPRGVRGRRSRSLLILGRCLSRPYGGHGQQG